MIKTYESIMILDKNANEEIVKEKVLKHFNNNNVKEIEYWGVKKLAYPVQKNNEGYYVRFIFTANEEEIYELNKLFSNSTDILKYIFVVLDSEEENYYNNKLEFEDSLYEILDTYTENSWKEEPLDGDEVDRLVEHLRNRLNLICGNITEEEYEKLEG